MSEEKMRLRILGRSDWDMDSDNPVHQREHEEWSRQVGVALDQLFEVLMQAPCPGAAMAVAGGLGMSTNAYMGAIAEAVAANQAANLPTSAPPATVDWGGLFS